LQFAIISAVSFPVASDDFLKPLVHLNYGYHNTWDDSSLKTLDFKRFENFLGWPKFKMWICCRHIVCPVFHPMSGPYFCTFLILPTSLSPSTSMSMGSTFVVLQHSIYDYDLYFSIFSLFVCYICHFKSQSSGRLLSSTSPAVVLFYGDTFDLFLFLHVYHYCGGHCHHSTYLCPVQSFNNYLFLRP